MSHRLIAIGAAQQKPGRAAEADHVVANLLRRDSRAANLLVQLRDGRRAILQAWMLLSEVN